MESKFDNNELDEMRVQMSEFKERLEKHVVVDENRLEKCVIKKMSSINNIGTKSFVVGTIAGLFIAIVGYVRTGYSLPLCIAFASFCIMDSFLDFKSSHMVTSKSVVAKTMTEIIKDLVRMRLVKRWQFIINSFFSLLLIVWLLLESFQIGFINPEIIGSNAFYYAIAFLAVCAIVGYSIAIYLYKKQQGNINDLMEMLSEK